jgi:hypothetical protein
MLLCSSYHMIYLRAVVANRVHCALCTAMIADCLRSASCFSDRPLLIGRYFDRYFDLRCIVTRLYYSY